jgi:capsular exopolysaccharide synthesis family protein
MSQTQSHQLLLNQSATNSIKQFQLLRNALFLNLRQAEQKVVLVTSPDDGQGKSTIAVNLAASYAEQGTATLLIDANFRNPSLQQEFSVSGETGLSDLEKALDAVQTTSVSNLSVLPAGVIPEDNSAIFLDDRFTALLVALASQFGMIIIDGDSILHRSDTQLLATLSEYTLVVVDHAQVRKADFINLQTELKENGVDQYGVVYNELPAKRKTYDF